MLGNTGWAGLLLLLAAMFSAAPQTKVTADCSPAPLCSHSRPVQSKAGPADQAWLALRWAKLGWVCYRPGQASKQSQGTQRLRQHC